MAKPEHHRAARAEAALTMRRAAGETGAMGDTIDHPPAGKPLAWIQERVERLQALVQELCQARLTQLQEAAKT